jgi:hypothetical protein
VRRLKSHRGRAEMTVIAAKGTLIIPGREDLAGPRGTATWALGPSWRHPARVNLVRVESDSDEDIAAYGHWEVALNEIPRHGISSGLCGTRLPPCWACRSIDSCLSAPSRARSSVTGSACQSAAVACPSETRNLMTSGRRVGNERYLNRAVFGLAPPRPQPQVTRPARPRPPAPGLRPIVGQQR